MTGRGAIVTKDRATIGTILEDNGYATCWLGIIRQVEVFAAYNGVDVPVNA